MMQHPHPSNPCLTCGACCATLRVSFYWSEADPALGGQVPVEYTQQLTPHLVCMKGTNSNTPRCVCLEGDVGGATRCTIHTLRPTPCRAFGVNWENGVLSYDEGELERCNKVRAKWGLEAITIE